MRQGADGGHLGYADSLPQVVLWQWLGEGAAPADPGLLGIQGLEGETFQHGARAKSEVLAKMVEDAAAILG